MYFYGSREKPVLFVPFPRPGGKKPTRYAVLKDRSVLQIYIYTTSRGRKSLAELRKRLRAPTRRAVALPPPALVFFFFFFFLPHDALAGTLTECPGSPISILCTVEFRVSTVPRANREGRELLSLAGLEKAPHALNGRVDVPWTIWFTSNREVTRIKDRFYVGITFTTLLINRGDFLRAR
jgi:hypothetical protein